MQNTRVSMDARKKARNQALREMFKTNNPLMTNVNGKNKLIQTHDFMKMLQFDQVQHRATHLQREKNIKGITKSQRKTVAEIIDVFQQFSFQTF